jgi:hypothetical protein
MSFNRRKLISFNLQVFYIVLLNLLHFVVFTVTPSCDNQLNPKNSGFNELLIILYKTDQISRLFKISTSFIIHTLGDLK